jgi:hypothetical protein
MVNWEKWEALGTCANFFAIIVVAILGIKVIETVKTVEICPQFLSVAHEIKEDKCIIHADSANTCDAFIVELNRTISPGNKIEVNKSFCEGLTTATCLK